MEPSLLNVLPNLSIGVVSVLALVYVVIKFLDAIDERATRHEKAMQEREHAIRQVESDVRSNLYTHLSQATHALQENTRVLERVMNHLDKV